MSASVPADCGPSFSRAAQPDSLVNQPGMGHHCQRLLLSGNTIRNDLQRLRGNVMMLGMRKSSSAGSETGRLKIASRWDVFTYSVRSWFVSPKTKGFFLMNYFRSCQSHRDARTVWFSTHEILIKVNLRNNSVSWSFQYHTPFLHFLSEAQCVILINFACWH